MNRLVACTIVLLVSCSMLSAQLAGTWATKTPMPTARVELSTGVVNGVVYAVGGRPADGGFTATVEAYDPASDTWAIKASMPTARAGLGASVVNSILYAVGGGSNNVSVLGTNEAFTPTPPYAAQIQQPINSDGSSVFNATKGVVPVKFTLALNSVATCALPPATIAVTRTAGGTLGSIDESVYVMAADSGSYYRINSCQYIYNIAAKQLGAGTYRADILINGQTVGNGVFALK